jgi:hypothetical protein
MVCYNSNGGSSAKNGACLCIGLANFGRGQALLLFWTTMNALQGRWDTNACTVICCSSIGGTLHRLDHQNIPKRSAKTMLASHSLWLTAIRMIPAMNVAGPVTVSVKKAAKVIFSLASFIVVASCCLQMFHFRALRCFISGERACVPRGVFQVFHRHAHQGCFIWLVHLLPAQMKQRFRVPPGSVSVCGTRLYLECRSF